MTLVPEHVVFPLPPELTKAALKENHEDRMRRAAPTRFTKPGCFWRARPVQQALRKIERLRLGIPHAVVEAWPQRARLTAPPDVDVLVTAEGLAEIHRKLEGLGYLQPFKGSKHLRDTENGVKVEFLVTGGFPGDGKPKSVAFPDPAKVGVVLDGIRYVNVETLLELKLASGISSPGRVKDLGDAQELIKELKLSLDLGARLDPYVRSEYQKLWKGAHESP